MKKLRAEEAGRGAALGKGGAQLTTITLPAGGAGVIVMVYVNSLTNVYISSMSLCTCPIMLKRHR